MITRGLLFSIALIALTLAASPALAQDGKPYDPRQFSRSELIDFGTYDAPPVEFDFEILSVEQRPEEKHVNFVITVGADYTTVVQAFEDAYGEREPIARLATGIMPYQSTRELKIVGKAKEAGSQALRYTLGSQGMTRWFSVDISTENGETVITMRNVVMSRLFSGVMPPREGFKPKGAKPVGLLYN